MANRHFSPEQVGQSSQHPLEVLRFALEGADTSDALPFAIAKKLAPAFLAPESTLATQSNDSPHAVLEVIRLEIARRDLVSRVFLGVSRAA